MEASKRNFDEWFVGVYNLDNGILEEAKKSGQKDYTSGLVIKKDDQRAQDAKLWEVA